MIFIQNACGQLFFRLHLNTCQNCCFKTTFWPQWKHLVAFCILIVILFSLTLMCCCQLYWLKCPTLASHLNATKNHFEKWFFWDCTFIYKVKNLKGKYIYLTFKAYQLYNSYRIFKDINPLIQLISTQKDTATLSNLLAEAAWGRGRDRCWRWAQGLSADYSDWTTGCLFCAHRTSADESCRCRLAVTWRELRGGKKTERSLMWYANSHTAFFKFY